MFNQLILRNCEFVQRHKETKLSYFYKGNRFQFVILEKNIYNDSKYRFKDVYITLSTQRHTRMLLKCQISKERFPVMHINTILKHLRYIHLEMNIRKRKLHTNNVTEYFIDHRLIILYIANFNSNK